MVISCHIITFMLLALSRRSNSMKQSLGTLAVSQWSKRPQRKATVAGGVCTADKLNMIRAKTPSALNLMGCEELELGMTHLGVEGAHLLASAMSSHGAQVLQRITHVNLTWTAIGVAGALELLAVLKKAPRLIALDLSGNWIGDAALSALALLLRSATQLRFLSMRWNDISAAGARIMSQALSLHANIIELDLGGNWIRGDGARAVADVIRNHPSIELLRLDNNGINDSGAKALAIALRNNSKLHTLHMGSNALEDSGVAALASTLLQSNGLRSLNLRLNQRVTDVAAARMAEALRANRQLTSLDLSGNRLSSQGGTSLARALDVNEVLSEMHLDDNCPHRAFGRALHGINGSILRAVSNTLATRRQPVTPDVAVDHAHGLDHPRESWNKAYWRLVYPLMQRGDATTFASRRRSTFFFFKGAPRSLMHLPCEQFSWAKCRLDAYFEAGRSPPRISQGSFFAPFRAPPGTCMRSLFSWEAVSHGMEKWEASYPYSAGIPDHTWSEVIHTRDQSGGSWMYLATGSGIFWNCGKSLRARNKVDAALRLTTEITPSLPAHVVRGSAFETLAHAISSNYAGACDGDHCQKFVELLNSTRTNRNDNCYGLCSSAKAPLSVWLQRAANGSGSGPWQVEQMSASSVFDEVVWKWAKRLHYDSVQLTMQPQVWCGLSWTTEMLDLRVKQHRTHELRKHLGIRDPLSPATRGEPCIVRSDNVSRKTFSLNIYCEGTHMERVARCLADNAFGKSLKKFTVYSQYSRHRFEACSGIF